MNPRATGSKVRRPSKPMTGIARSRRHGPMARPLNGRRPRRKRRIGRKLLFLVALSVGLWYGYTDLWPVVRGWVGFAADLPPAEAALVEPEAEPAPGQQATPRGERPRLRPDYAEPALNRREAAEQLEQKELAEADRVNASSFFDRAFAWIDERLASMFSVRQIRLQGERTLPRAELLASLDTLRGTPLLPLDPPALADSLRAHPRVRNAAIGKQLPGTVNVILEERTEIALTLVDGTLWGLDEECALLPLPEGGWPLDMPVVVGLTELPPPGSPVNQPAARAALSWVIEARRLPRVHAWLAEVQVAGDSVAALIGQDGRTLLAGGHAVAAQTAALDALLARENGRPRGNLIDLTFPDYLIVRDDPWTGTTTTTTTIGG